MGLFISLWRCGPNVVGVVGLRNQLVHMVRFLCFHDIFIPFSTWLSVYVSHTFRINTVTFLSYWSYKVSSKLWCRCNEVCVKWGPSAEWHCMYELIQARLFKMAPTLLPNSWLMRQWLVLPMLVVLWSAKECRSSLVDGNEALVQIVGYKLQFT